VPAKRILPAFRSKTAAASTIVWTVPCIVEGRIAESNRQTAVWFVDRLPVPRSSEPIMALGIFGSSEIPRAPVRLQRAELGFFGRIVNTLLAVVLIAHVALRSRRQQSGRLTSASRIRRRR
jgi:hypothetical protein